MYDFRELLPAIRSNLWLAKGASQRICTAIRARGRVVLIGRVVSILYKDMAPYQESPHVIPITSTFVLKKEDLRMVQIS